MKIAVFYSKSTLLLSLAAAIAYYSSAGQVHGAPQVLLETRLVPAGTDFELGKPILFRIEMTNKGQATVNYDAQSVGVNKSLIVRDKLGNELPYIGGFVQTEGGPRPLEPGHTVTLRDKLDIRDQYLILKAGDYTVEFRGTYPAFKDVRIPPAPPVTIHVKPGQISLEERLARDLLVVLPKSWQLNGIGRVKRPLKNQKQLGMISIVLVGPSGPAKGALTYVFLWLTDGKIDTASFDSLYPISSSSYFGKGSDGHYYLAVRGELERVWPKAKAELSKVFGISRRD